MSEQTRTPPIVKLGALIFLKGQMIWFTRNGTRETAKTISNAALRTAVSGLVLDTGWLDPSIRLLRWQLDRKHQCTVVYRPPARATLRMEQDDTTIDVLNVPLPGLIFGSRNEVYTVWAVKGEPHPTSLLFFAPFPNVYLDGHVCWGDNPHAPPGPEHVAESLATFLRTPFTGHGADRAAVHYKKDVRELWRALAGLPSPTALPGLEGQPGPGFPEDELMPAHLTLTEALDRMVNPDKKLYVPLPGANVR